MAWSWKDFAIIVAAGVVTAIAIEFALKYLRDQAILSARGEMQRVLMATTQQQTNVTQPQQSSAPSVPIEGAPLLSDGNVGYTNLDKII